MKNVIKNPVFTFILGVIITGSISGVVALSYKAKDVEFTPSDSSWNVNTVEDALKDLKVAKEHKENGTEVARITDINQSYTFENDGYVIGTLGSSNSKGGEIYYVVDGNDTLVGYVPYNDSSMRPFEKFCKKGATIYTRADSGRYDLTIYEYK